MRATLSTIIALLGAAALGACGDDYDDPAGYRRPLIDEARPAEAPPGAQVTLLGHNFGLLGDEDGLWLGGVEVPVESWSDREVFIRIPDGAGVGLRDLVMRSGPWISPPHTFEILPPAETPTEP